MRLTRLGFLLFTLNLVNICLADDTSAVCPSLEVVRHASITTIHCQSPQTSECSADGFFTFSAQLWSLHLTFGRGLFDNPPSVSEIKEHLNTLSTAIDETPHLVYGDYFCDYAGDGFEALVSNNYK